MQGLRRTVGVLVLALSLATAVPASAATGETTEATGPVTNLPLPRFVSMKAREGNVRRGPSLSHRIDWVFKHENMPLRITGEYGHWRRVEDRDGAGGWMHYTLLSGVRTVLIDVELAPLRAQPSTGAPERARAEAGVIARLEKCTPDWCRIKANAVRGWVRKSEIWGVGPDELRD